MIECSNCNESKNLRWCQDHNVFHCEKHFNECDAYHKATCTNHQHGHSFTGWASAALGKTPKPFIVGKPKLEKVE